ncbi:hypothetical protein MVES1_002426 [Malassezia vespertilionis]|uniref:chitin deacetylase n=1 Tax=Malassezia vespertilionis TaxID=2020962 RepID=A0A2N1JBS2_9BASI|nr:uncharacterized protein MVES1_002426 [Malassezia vespertilionis]PKI83997.1 hypothetical protein MVES_002294 [Malassezia vespertilionis]WFD07070.1 hypothetical protein MVES1_002426 [Malassezia vespertilionis]
MQLTVTNALCALALLSLSVTDAHMGRGFSMPTNDNMAANHLRRGLSRRAQPSNAQEMASANDAKVECEGGSNPAFSQLLKDYPKADKIASIMDGDDQGRKVWEDIKSQKIIPNDVHKKATTDKEHYEFSDEGYDADKDPDCWWSASTCTKPKHDRLQPDVSECPLPNSWGLSFDDGPNCSHNAFYDFLKEKELKATLFYIGGNILSTPLQAQRGFAEGHDICVHTWSHRYMTTLTDTQVFAELYYTMRIIKDTMGVTPRCWRPPYGDVDDRVRAIATALGLRTMLWSDDTDDWNITPDGKSPTSKINSNYQNIIDQAKNGSLDTHGVGVLTHELTDNTMNEFIKEYPKIEKAFKHVLPLSACLNATHPYPEDGVSYPGATAYIQGSRANGLPPMDNMPINPSSALNISALDQQTSAGGFSTAAAKASPDSGEETGKSKQGNKSTSSNAEKKDDNAAATLDVSVTLLAAFASVIAAIVVL